MPSFCVVQCLQSREGLESVSEQREQGDMAEFRKMLKKQQEPFNLGRNYSSHPPTQ